MFAENTLATLISGRILGSGTTTNTTPVSDKLPWHLKATSGSTVGIDAQAVWADYTGRKVSVGVFDDGVDTKAVGLQSGATLASGTLGTGEGRHGTAVAGIIGADATSASPAVGVAYDAAITVHKILGTTSQNLAIEMAKQSQYDVVNHSWGWGAAFLIDKDDPTYRPFLDTLAQAAESGRGGLGTSMVLAAGNFRAMGIDTNASQFTNDRHVITVTALTSEGKLTSYANGGASVLVAAPSAGGKLGGIVTSDVAGASGYSAGDYTTDFGGTSAAAPQVSGVVALMLDANPHLGWRDIKDILALSAQKVGGLVTTVNGANNWNGGGMGFSNDAGFGIVDAKSAVRLAETWFEQRTSSNEVSVSAQLKTATAIKDKGTTELKFSLAAGVSVETIKLDLGLKHSDVSQLSIDLISPDGTSSKLLPQIANGGAIDGWVLTSNAFLGEDSGGIWTLRVTDYVKFGTGSISTADLTAFGSAQTKDQTFFYSDDFSKVANADRTMLSAPEGVHSINAAMVSSASTIDLAARSMVIDGVNVKISADTKIDRVFGGDGNDTIVGDQRDNVLVGGRGDDMLRGGAGNDLLVGGSGNNVLDGGAGIDIAVMDGKWTDWLLSNDSLGVHLTKTNAANTLINVERVAFDDGLLALDTENGLAGFGYRIYQAAFDRVPDLQGLSFWVKQLDKGMSALEVAARFMDSNEFRTLYGAQPTNEVFVEKLYGNVLDRTPDAGGKAFWLEQLANGTYDRAEVLARFSDSAENRMHVAPELAHGILLSHEYLVF